VEAASPALIEKVRTVVTDEQGQYKIIDLRPGTYTVTFTLTGFALVTALVVAFLLGNLALRPMEEISMQLDYWTAASAQEDEEQAPKQDTADRVSDKIERIGQRMRNVEEVFSALKENLDQVLGNLQDGILLFTADGRAVLVSEAARRFLNNAVAEYNGAIQKFPAVLFAGMMGFMPAQMFELDAAEKVEDVNPPKVSFG